MPQNSEKVAAIARSAHFQQRVRAGCMYVARQAQITNAANKADVITAFLKITNSQKPGNLERVALAILLTNTIITKVTDQNLGGEVEDATDLVPVLTANMITYADLCE
jgi:ABC-type lipopolysaccharide export system ATPase subunit